MFVGFSEYDVIFECIVAGFAESRLWECRVFSFKIARALQKSRVFPGKGSGPGFSFSCRPSALDRPLFERGRRIFCMHFTGFPDNEVTFERIFTGFAEIRLWECRVFSFKNGRAS